MNDIIQVQILGAWQEGQARGIWLLRYGAIIATLLPTVWSGGAYALLYTTG